LDIGSVGWLISGICTLESATLLVEKCSRDVICSAVGWRLICPENLPGLHALRVSLLSIIAEGRWLSLGRGRRPQSLPEPPSMWASKNSRIKIVHTLSGRILFLERTIISRSNFMVPLALCEYDTYYALVKILLLSPEPVGLSEWSKRGTFFRLPQAEQSFRFRLPSFGSCQPQQPNHTHHSKPTHRSC